MLTIMNEPEVAKIFFNRAEADLAKSYLLENDIESVILADDCAGQHPHLILSSGGVKLLVTKKDLDKAKRLLDK